VTEMRRMRETTPRVPGDCVIHFPRRVWHFWPVPLSRTLLQPGFGTAGPSTRLPERRGSPIPRNAQVRPTISVALPGSNSLYHSFPM
jgi:hypothetical protein